MSHLLDTTKRKLDPTSLPQISHPSQARSAVDGQKHPQQNHNKSENDNSTLHPEQELESIDMPPHIGIMPPPLLTLISEWLVVKDLLASRRVNRSFYELSKDEYLWKKLACFLWTSALVDAGSSSLAEESNAHLHEDAPGECVLAKDPCLAISCPYESNHEKSRPPVAYGPALIQT